MSLRMIKMIGRELISGGGQKRVPEPSSIMNIKENVTDFHQQGAFDGPLIPIYLLNALSLSRLIPENGSLMDLGSGTGQFLMFLARLRPDINIYGVELAPEMIAMGNEEINNEGLEHQIHLVCGDMTQASSLTIPKCQMVSSIFSLHHLSDFSAAEVFLQEVGKINLRDGSGFWLFDHARPKNFLTADEFPEIFTPYAPEAFKNDSRNSLKASFSFSEMMDLLKMAFPEGLRHSLARLLPFYQIHWQPPQGASMNAARVNYERFVSMEAMRKFNILRRLLPNLPL